MQQFHSSFQGPITISVSFETFQLMKAIQVKTAMLTGLPLLINGEQMWLDKDSGEQMMDTLSLLRDGPSDQSYTIEISEEAYDQVSAKAEVDGLTVGELIEKVLKQNYEQIWK